MGIINRFSLVFALVAVLAVNSFAGSAIIYVEDGQLIADTAGIPIVAIFIDGPDVTSLCSATEPNIFTGPGNYCNSDPIGPNGLQFNLGADNGLFETVLGYSGDNPNGQTQWLFVSAASFSGILIDNLPIAADNGRGVSVNDLIGQFYTITSSPDTDGQVFTGVINPPEPSSALLSLLGLAWIAVRRR